jgi:hypothetical protein
MPQNIKSRARDVANYYLCFMKNFYTITMVFTDGRSMGFLETRSSITHKYSGAIFPGRLFLSAQHGSFHHSSYPYTWH